MTVHQLSVFVENKSGTLLKILELLKEAGIQLIASTISDTVEYGIYRIICSEPERAYDTLKSAGIAANISDVFAIKLDNQPGRLRRLYAVLLMPESVFHISTLSFWTERESWCSARIIRKKPVR